MSSSVYGYRATEVIIDGDANHTVLKPQNPQHIALLEIVETDARPVGDIEYLSLNFRNREARR